MCQKQTSLDHLVGASDERRRHGEAKRLCGLEIDDELEFGGCLHGKLAWLLTFQNAVGVFGRPPKIINEIVSVRQETASPRRTDMDTRRAGGYEPQAI
jgi:hypothetical protein